MDRLVPDSRPITILMIGGSDTSSGAGIQADLKVISAHGAYGVTAITAVTAQSAHAVMNIHPMTSAVVADQMITIFENFNVAAVKCGMLPDVSIVETVAEILNERCLEKPIVVDPVVCASSGDSLIEARAVTAIVELLFPIASLVTPNKNELETIAETKVSSLDSAERVSRLLLKKADCKAILVKGGHFLDTVGTDLLVVPERSTKFKAKQIFSRSFHGTGCAYASAIAAWLAQGANLIDAVQRSKEYLHETMLNSFESGGEVKFLDHFSGNK